MPRPLETPVWLLLTLPVFASILAVRRGRTLGDRAGGVTPRLLRGHR